MAEFTLLSWGAGDTVPQMSRLTGSETGVPLYLIVSAAFDLSRSEARRLIRAGAVRIYG